METQIERRRHVNENPQSDLAQWRDRRMEICADSASRYVGSPHASVGEAAREAVFERLGEPLLD